MKKSRPMRKKFKPCEKIYSTHEKKALSHEEIISTDEIKVLSNKKKEITHEDMNPRKHGKLTRLTRFSRLAEIKSNIETKIETNTLNNLKS